MLSAVGLISANSAVAQCPCNYMVCAVCVQTTLPAIKASTQASFQSLNALQQTLDQTIAIGVEAETKAIDNSRNNIVGAIQADALNVSAAIMKNAIAEERLLDSLKISFEDVARSKSIAKQNHEAATQYGTQNISHVTKTISNLQYSTIVPHNNKTEPGTINGVNSNQEDNITDIHFLLDEVESRTSNFRKGILESEEDGSAIFSMNTLMQGDSVIRLKADVISEGDWIESLALRKFMAVPPGVQAGLRSMDIKDNDGSGYWRISQRSRSAAEFLAWDLAIRSGFTTDEGETSLIHLLKSMVDQTASSTEGMIADAVATDRALLNTIAANEAISNLLDIMLLTADQYESKMEAAKVGHFTDEEFNPIYGSNKIKSTLTTIERGKDE